MGSGFRAYPDLTLSPVTISAIDHSTQLDSFYSRAVFGPDWSPIEPENFIKDDVITVKTAMPDPTRGQQPSTWLGACREHDGATVEANSKKVLKSIAEKRKDIFEVSSGAGSFCGKKLQKEWPRRAKFWADNRAQLRVNRGQSGPEKSSDWNVSNCVLCSLFIN